MHLPPHSQTRCRSVKFLSQFIALLALLEISQYIKNKILTTHFCLTFAHHFASVFVTFLPSFCSVLSFLSFFLSFAFNVLTLPLSTFYNCVEVKKIFFMRINSFCSVFSSAMMSVSLNDIDFFPSNRGIGANNQLIDYFLCIKIFFNFILRITKCIFLV